MIFIFLWVNFYDYSLIYWIIIIYFNKKKFIILFCITTNWIESAGYSRERRESERLQWEGSSDSECCIKMVINLIQFFLDNQGTFHSQVLGVLTARQQPAFVKFRVSSVVGFKSESEPEPCATYWTTLPGVWITCVSYLILIKCSLSFSSLCFICFTCLFMDSLNNAFVSKYWRNSKSMNSN